MKPFTMLAIDVAALTILVGGALAAPLAIKNSGSFEPNLVIDAPEGTTWEEKFTNTVVTKGKNFQIMISAGMEDIPKLKKAHAGPDSLITEVKKYDVDEKDTVLYEGVMFGQKGYHFVTNVKIGKSMFKCTDWRKPDGVYSKADAEVMLKACKTLKKGKK